MSRAFLLSVLPIAGLAVACSSIEDKPLSETTREELIELCEDNEDLFPKAFDPSLARGSCILILDQGGECSEEAIARCIDQQRSNVEPDATQVDCNETDETLVQNCDATVGEYLDCLEATTEIFEGYASLSCGEGDQVLSFTLPEACGSLQAECPEIFGAEDG